ncbi:MAG: hypothetical protein KBD53_04555 [Candidatus Omnitrophica bacterium]|nr:hypothetical protein [Candidatus Omnitrophota bacterium]
MKDWMMLLIGIFVVFGTLVYGITKFTKKAYEPPQRTQTEMNQIFEKKVAQQQNMDDVERRRKDLMRQQKQRLRDMQRR